MLGTDRPHPVPGCTLAQEPEQDGFVLYHRGWRSLLRLNPLGALVWSLCDGQRSVEDITALLEEAYGSDRAVRTGVQQVLGILAGHGALELLAQRSYDIPILLYHKVVASPPPGNTVWLSTRLFAEQMAALHAAGYHTVSLADYLSYRRGDAEPPAHPVILTLDDGYENQYRVARPILAQYGFRATVFLVTSHIGGGPERPDNRWEGPLAGDTVGMLLWSEAADLAATGYEIGSHSLSHPYLTTLEDETAEHEISRSAADVQAHLGLPTRFFAYPFGAGAGVPYLQGMVQRAGYAAAVATQTVVANTLSSPIWALPRLKVTEEHCVEWGPAGPAGPFMRLLRS
jgi:peptidoglycan/xylan/chitin deacetylase (PgdA/CDA1 family)